MGNFTEGQVFYDVPSQKYWEIQSVLDFGEYQYLIFDGKALSSTLLRNLISKGIVIGDVTDLIDLYYDSRAR